MAMAPRLIEALGAGDLLLWDRGFFSYELIQAVLERGSRLLARVKANWLKFRRFEELSDGSYLSKIYPTDYARLHDQGGRWVRIIEYTHNDPTRPGCGVISRLLTDLLDDKELPASEAVLLYHQRWEEELAFDEIKTHLNGREVLLRSKTPRLVVQELYGLILAHRVIRQVMAAAAAPAAADPRRLSFTSTLTIVQCRLPESLQQSPEQWYAGLLVEVARQKLRLRRERWYPRVIRRRVKPWATKKPKHHNPPQPSKKFADAIVIR
jgi:hypothetical protein